MTARRTRHRLRALQVSMGKTRTTKTQSGCRGKWRGRGTPGAFGGAVANSRREELWRRGCELAAEQAAAKRARRQVSNASTTPP